MKITFDTESINKLPNHDEQISQSDLKQAADIVFSVFHYLRLLECGHLIDLIKVTYEADPPGTKSFSPLFQIIIDLTPFGHKKIKILLQRPLRSRKLIFKKEEPEDIFDFPIKAIDINTTLPLDIAFGLISAIDLVIKQQSDSIKEKAEKFTFIRNKIAEIAKY